MKLSVLWHAENTVCRGPQCRMFSILLWDPWCWHWLCPSGRAQARFPPTRHDVPNLSGSNTKRPRRVVKSSRAAKLKLPQRPQRRPLYDAGADTSRKLLPSQRTLTPICVSTIRLSSVLLIVAFPSSLYGAVTLWPFTLRRIFWPRLIFTSPTCGGEKWFASLSGHPWRTDPAGRQSHNSLCLCLGGAYFISWLGYKLTFLKSFAISLRTSR